MENSKDYDLIVLGGGSAGLSLSSIAARLGVKVALVDKGNLGGDCLHYGCVPSKTLIESAKVAHAVRTSKKYGIESSLNSVDFTAVMSRIRNTISTIQDHADNADRFRAMGCDVWTQTEATFINKHTVSLGDKTITGNTVAICTGSRPTIVPIEGMNEADFLTNETIFSLRELPKKLTVLGSGPIGCELAQAFARLGSDVTVINRSQALLKKEDDDVQGVIRKTFENEGIRLMLGYDIVRGRCEADRKVLTVSKNGKEEEVEATHILMALGRTGNADGLRAANAGVNVTENGYVLTDEYLRTDTSNIWAAGDVTGRLQFTHSAGFDAGILVRNAVLLPSFLRRKPFMKRALQDHIPWVTFTQPEAASYGLNEKAAKEKGIDHTVSHFEFSHQDRALAAGKTDGFIKLILGKRDQILGCQIVGENAGELIHEWVLAGGAGVSLSAISRLTHAYPTLSGANQQAAGAYLAQKFFTEKSRNKVRKFLGYRNEKIDK